MHPSRRWSDLVALHCPALSPLAGLALTAALIALPVRARAQEREPSPTISSDRPGLGDAAYVLAPGEWQIELGGSIDGVPNDDYLVGSSLVRIGFRQIEMRVYVPDIVTLYRDQFLRLGDLGVGAKVPLRMGGEGWRWAAEGVLTLPSGSESLSAGDAAGYATMLAEADLGDGVVLALNAGYGSVFNDFGHGTLSLLVTPNFAIPGHDGLGAYVGYAGYLRQGEDTHYVEGGLYKLDGADRQWDVNAGYDPNGHVWFLGIGVAQRWRQ